MSDKKLKYICFNCKSEFDEIFDFCDNCNCGIFQKLKNSNHVQGAKYTFCMEATQQISPFCINMCHPVAKQTSRSTWHRSVIATIVHVPASNNSSIAFT
jgi:DNA-directed RNA polymerase subunit RPC12/RpoP